ncbi:helix-turn-helix domain-containing protein [Pseudomonas quasicaspiana]|uniref:helix-turn-helix domain-containing protein n=1 Tax=Pseudomonas quasicaspiana TaxID=2829821 RepID=UPI001E4EAF59|nr:AraC family transcriptional regulator [Pseudomonas quasicaspiana]MCD5973350.1 helix-turn-helix transcriptional regulator [Pseudomonas quasicaspiana]
MDNPLHDVNDGLYEPVTGGLSPDRLALVKQLITADLSKKVSVPFLAASCELTRSHFSRSFKRSTGMSPQEWIRNQRIEQAKELIKESAMTLTQISAECGFCDQAHFSHMFSKTEGTNPARWRGHARKLKAASLRQDSRNSRHIWTLEINPLAVATANGSRPKDANPLCS